MKSIYGSRIQNVKKYYLNVFQILLFIHNLHDFFDLPIGFELYSEEI